MKKAKPLIGTTGILLCAAIAIALILTFTGRSPAGAEDDATPAKPTDLTGSLTYKSVTLNWTAPENSSITGYQILRLQRGVDELGNFHTHVDDTGDTATSFTDTDVEANARYVYRVKARNGNQLSDQSNFFNANLPAPPPQVTVNFGQAAYSVAEGQSVDIKVTLDIDPERTVQIPISATNQGDTQDHDYSGVPSFVTFNGGDTEQTFSVTATDDVEDDPGKSLSLSLGSLPDRVTAGATTLATISITDNDAPPQEPVQLVGNMTRSFSDKAAVYTGTKLAIRFTTGPAANNWSMTAIRLQVARWAKGVTPTVALHEAGTGDEPGAHIATITNPKKGNGKRLFPSPADTILQPETTYAVVLSSDGADTGNAVEFRTTGKDQDDDGAAPGWSLADHSLRLSSGSWSTTDAAIKTAVVGTYLGPPNNVPSGTPQITGTAQVGETLTADTSNIADADGLTTVSYNYQWVRKDDATRTDITGATGTDYTLTLADPRQERHGPGELHRRPRQSRATQQPGNRDNRTGHPSPYISRRGYPSRPDPHRWRSPLHRLLRRQTAPRPVRRRNCIFRHPGRRSGRHSTGNGTPHRSTPHGTQPGERAQRPPRTLTRYGSNSRRPRTPGAPSTSCSAPSTTAWRSATAWSPSPASRTGTPWRRGPSSTSPGTGRYMRSRDLRK